MYTNFISFTSWTYQLMESMICPFMKLDEPAIKIYVGQPFLLTFIDLCDLFFWVTSNILPTTKKTGISLQPFWHLHFPMDLPSGKLLHDYGKSPFLMGKSTIFMAIFNIAMFVYQRVPKIIVRWVSCVSFCRTSCSVCPLTTPPDALKRLFDLVGHAAGVAGAESAVRGILCGLELGTWRSTPVDWWWYGVIMLLPWLYYLMMT